VVPDLPLEETARLSPLAAAQGLDLVLMTICITPFTSVTITGEVVV
jgi:tryptophan synthase alpha subunit